MVRRALGSLTLLALCASAPAQGAAPAAAPPAGDELKNIHEMLEQQSQQLDVLAQEVARLNLLLQSRNDGEAGPPPTAPANPAPRGLDNFAIPVAPAAPPLPADTAAAAPSPAPGGPAPGGLTHEVTKGETLTSIARHYKVTVGDLLKINKITDVRKLQIGQTLILPPGAKPQESPTPEPK